MTDSVVRVIDALGLAGALFWIVKASVVLAAGALAVRATRRARASVRAVLLAATFSGLLALPLLMAFSPVVTIPGLALRSPAASAARNVDARHTTFAPRSTPRDGARTSAAAEPAAVSLATAGVAVRTVWAVIAVILMSALALSVRRLRRLARTGVPWLEAQPLVADLAAAAGLRRTVHVVRHEQVAAPFTCGVRRPIVVLPWDAREWSDADVRRALVHEIEHVRRADWPMVLLARVTCSLYWFHPLAWRALNALCLEVERACDDAVLTSSGSEDYADQLVALAARVRDGGPVPALAMAGRSDLSVRVLALLDSGQRRGRAGRWAVATTMTVALLGVGLIGAVRTVAAAAQPPRPASERQAEHEDESSPNYALYHAAARGDIRLMTALIDGGADVNAALGGDGSPLIAAARAGRLPAVQLLLDRGADVNLGVGGDGNPLIMAAREGELEVLRLLLDRGARVDEVVDGDENALIQAAANGRLEAAKLLVQRGADVNARVWADSYDGRGEWRTPLSQARRGGHSAVIAFLEASGATR